MASRALPRAPGRPATLVFNDAWKAPWQSPNPRRSSQNLIFGIQAPSPPIRGDPSVEVGGFPPPPQSMGFPEGRGRPSKSVVERNSMGWVAARGPPNVGVLGDVIFNFLRIGNRSIWRSGRPRGPGIPLRWVGGFAPPPFGIVSRAPGTAQTPKITDFRSLTKFKIL